MQWRAQVDARWCYITCSLLSGPSDCLFEGLFTVYSSLYVAHDMIIDHFLMKRLNATVITVHLKMPPCPQKCLCTPLPTC